MKPQHVGSAVLRHRMPPTRGHDLKLKWVCKPYPKGIDAPHTGARLETLRAAFAPLWHTMPPTRGHDLKPATGH